jgi:ribonuclease III
VSANEAAHPEELQERLGVQFRDPALLEQALTHRSVLRDSAVAGQQSNERLEFLGDAIIGALVARYLYGRLPRATEGELTLLRTWLVRASTLAEWAASLDLGRYLRLGRSDEATTRRTRLLARTFEAVVGAIYADQGIRGVAKFLRPFIRNEFQRRAHLLSQLDAKSRLQQVTQSRLDLVPVYTVLDVTGPGHEPTFTVEVRLGDDFRASAQGPTKQQAEQAAARLALEHLEASPARRPGAAREESVS